MAGTTQRLVTHDTTETMAAQVYHNGISRKSPWHSYSLDESFGSESIQQSLYFTRGALNQPALYFERPGQKDFTLRTGILQRDIQSIGCTNGSRKDLALNDQLMVSSILLQSLSLFRVRMSPECHYYLCKPLCIRRSGCRFQDREYLEGDLMVL